MFWVISAIIVVIAFFIGAFILEGSGFDLLGGIISVTGAASVIIILTFLINPAFPAEISEVRDYPVSRQGDNTLYYIDDDNEQHHIGVVAITEDPEFDQVTYRISKYDISNWPKQPRRELLIPTEYDDNSDTKFILQSLNYIVIPGKK